jgi:hypothetical protein
MSPDKLNFIDKTLDALKTAIPLSGLAISDKERLEIVTAIGLGQGHWFKCPKGECSYIICFLSFSTMLWETVEKRTNILPYEFELYKHYFLLKCILQNLYLTLNRSKLDPQKMLVLFSTVSHNMVEKLRLPIERQMPFWRMLAEN